MYNFLEQPIKSTLKRIKLLQMLYIIYMYCIFKVNIFLNFKEIQMNVVYKHRCKNEVKFLNWKKFRIATTTKQIEKQQQQQIQ